MSRSNIGMDQILPLMLFELKLQWKKFISIMIISVAVVILPNLFIYVLNPNISLPHTQESFLGGNLTILLYFSPIIAGLLFSGIICSEYKNKTGLTVFPLISKGKILIAKYITNYLLLVATITFFYALLILYDYYFYAEWIIPSIFLSYGFILLYLLALTSLICFFSSILPSSTSVLLIELILIIVGFDLISTMVNAVNHQIEPIFSLTYLFNIISASLNSEFFELPRFYEYSEGGNITRMWLFPDALSAVLVFILYFVICIILSYLLFKRREL